MYLILILIGENISSTSIFTKVGSDPYKIINSTGILGFNRVSYSSWARINFWHFVDITLRSCWSFWESISLLTSYGPSITLIACVNYFYIALAPCSPLNILASGSLFMTRAIFCIVMRFSSKTNELRFWVSSW